MNWKTDMPHIKLTTFSAGEISLKITSGNYEYKMHAYLKNDIAYSKCFVDMKTTARYKDFCAFDAWDLLLAYGRLDMTR
jgi:hypothetical protein